MKKIFTVLALFLPLCGQAETVSVTNKISIIRCSQDRSGRMDIHTAGQDEALSFVPGQGKRVTVVRNLDGDNYEVMIDSEHLKNERIDRYKLDAQVTNLNTGEIAYLTMNYSNPELTNSSIFLNSGAGGDGWQACKDMAEASPKKTSLMIGAWINFVVRHSGN